MARQQWRIRVRGKQREQVNVDMLTAAVIALGEQLAAEKRVQVEPTSKDGPTSPRALEQEEAQ